MFSEKQNAFLPLVVDVAGRGISAVSQIPGGGRDVAALTADNNRLSTLNGIQNFASLIQFSACSNSLVHISAVSSLTRLVTLNLQSNSIAAIEGLDSLTQLEWLGLAGNSIKVMSGLSCNTRLNHLDLSDNCITVLGNISMLHNLKTLLLHGNAVTSLKSIPDYFPVSLTTLSLAENHVQDLNEVSFLSALPELSQMSLMGNPCVSFTQHTMLFDYRPYVVYCCPRVSSLDGIIVTAEEKLRSVSLFQSDHAYPFRLGQHQSLVHYLRTACPLQQQLYSVPGQSVTSDPSSHTLFSQALSLQNPQQKAEVMQKLRVLQVLEQMISQQENLLNTQQPTQKPQAETDVHTNSRITPHNTESNPTHGEKHDRLQDSMLLKSHEHVDMRSDTLNSSLADTTLTEVTDLTKTVTDVMCVRGEGGEETEGIMPQPSLPFDIVQDGSAEFVKEVLSDRQTVRIAWAEDGTDDDQKDSVQMDRSATSVRGELERAIEGGGREGEGGGGRGEVERGEGRGCGGRGDEGGRGDGGEQERQANSDGMDEPDFETLKSVSSRSSLSFQSLPSNVANMTTYSEKSLHSPSAVGTVTSGKKITRMNTGTMTSENEITRMNIGAMTSGIGISGMGIGTMGSGNGMSIGTMASGIMGIPSTTTSDVVEPANISESGLSHKREAGMTSHSNAAVGMALHSRSTTSWKTLHTTTCTNANSSKFFSGGEMSTVSLPGVGSVMEDYRNMQAASTSGITPAQSTFEHSTDKYEPASNPPSNDTVEEGNPLEIKYSSPVDPQPFLTKEGELRLSQGTLMYTDILESESRFLPVPGSGTETSPAREWDLSALASSLSQAYGIADFSERTNLLATLVSRKSLDGDSETEPERERMTAEPKLDNTRRSVANKECSGWLSRDEEKGEGDGEGKGEGEGGGGQRGEREEMKGDLLGAVDTGEQEGTSGDMVEGMSRTENLKSGTSEAMRERQNHSEDANSPATVHSTPQIVPKLLPRARTPPPCSPTSYQHAVLTLQAGVRGYLCRKSLRVYVTRQHAATTIQATWRGYRSRIYNPVVVDVRRELSRKKMESYVTTVYLQLNGCREEMAHQAQILQLQEETIASLIQEVESLHAWRRETEMKKMREAALTIQKYWRWCKSRREHKVDLPCQKLSRVECLQQVCSELRQQVQDLQGKVVSLQDSCSQQGRDSAMIELGDISLPAPSRLTMCKHSSDTILLQWTASVASNSASLLGYRVYVNGIEEGMVGPTKNRAYIEGLDTSSTYRISLRAVYNLGESEDSNTLLLASVHLPTDDDQRTCTLTPSGSLEKEVISQPRLSQPPLPTELPALVSKTSALSKSESCLVLETVSVASSTSIEARSLSLNQLLDKNLDCVGQTTPVVPTSVDQTGTNVDQTLPSVDEMTSPPTNEKHGQPKPSCNELELTTNTHSCSSCFPRQEIKHDLSVGHFPLSHMACSNDHMSAASNTTSTDPCTVSGRAVIQGGEVPLQLHASSVFTGKDIQPLESESEKSHTVVQLCLQTQPPLTSINEAGKTEALCAETTEPRKVSRPSDIPVAGVDAVKTNSEIENLKVVAASANNPRSPRLAAKFDAHMRSDCHTSASSIIPASQPQRNQSDLRKIDHVHVHTTQLPNHHSLKPHSDVWPTHSLQLRKDSSSVGKTERENRASLSEVYSQQIDFSGEGWRVGGLVNENITVSHEDSQEHSQGMHLGMLDCDSHQPIAATSNVAHLSTCPHQPVIQTTLRLDKSQVPLPLGSVGAASSRHTGHFVALLPVNSDTPASTLVTQLEADLKKHESL